MCAKNLTIGSVFEGWSGPAPFLFFGLPILASIDCSLVSDRSLFFFEASNNSFERTGFEQQTFFTASNQGQGAKSHEEHSPLGKPFMTGRASSMDCNKGKIP
jgi:hypothetical protein